MAKKSTTPRIPETALATSPLLFRVPAVERSAVAECFEYGYGPGPAEAPTTGAAWQAMLAALDTAPAQVADFVRNGMEPYLDEALGIVRTGDIYGGSAEWVWGGGTTWYRVQP